MSQLDIERYTLVHMHMVYPYKKQEYNFVLKTKVSDFSLSLSRLHQANPLLSDMCCSIHHDQQGTYKYKMFLQ